MQHVEIQLSEEALEFNLKTLRNQIGDRDLFVAIKGNAYGHGLEPMARMLESEVDGFCVTLMNEAETLRSMNIKSPILIIGHIDQEDVARAIDLDVTVFLFRYDTAEACAKAAQAHGGKLRVHLKVDTGMQRQGVWHEEAEELLDKLVQLDGIVVEGISSHFAVSDDMNDRTYYDTQKRVFVELVTRVRAKYPSVKQVHCANTGSLLTDDIEGTTMVRAGIGVYGYYPSQSVADRCLKKGIELKPVLSLRSRVIHVKKAKKGSAVGYGCTFTTERDSVLAILPIGYYDGVDRRLSNKGSVLIRGQRAPIVGRVCMNHIILDVTHIEGVELHDEALIIGAKKDDRITADEIAGHIGTVNYEVITRLAEHIPRTINSGKGLTF